VKDVIKLLDRIGSVGALLAAAAAPCCFPLFAAVAAASGLTVLSRFETTVLYIFQGFALLAILGLALNYRKHRRFGPLALGMLSGLALAYAFHYSWNVELLYAGLFGIVIASVWNWFCSRANGRSEPLLQSIVTCPSCGYRAEETMPSNACLFFYDCRKCGARLKPRAGDCCVFCSYGSVPCPPIQTGAACCT
jgi:prepilin signal peptidase PulO-like enzyme (type II secretory pathway)